MNVICSVAGCARGGHYHKLNSEAFYVISGSFTLALRKGGAREAHEIKAGDMFRIGPGIAHDFHFHEDCLLVSLYSDGVEQPDGTKDIWDDGAAATNARTSGAE